MSNQIYFLFIIGKFFHSTLIKAKGKNLEATDLKKFDLKNKIMC